MVVRAHLLTNVTPINQLTDLSTQIDRDLSLELDREIGDASRGVEHARRGQRARGTCVDTTSTRAATIARERRIGLEIEIE